MGDLGGEPVERRRPGPQPAATARRSSIWPSIYPRILDQVLEHRSTIIFCNARRQAERLAAKLNELAEERGIGVDPETGHAARGARPGPPRLARPRAAHRHRGPAQARRPAGDRRHQQPRARHRHGRRRPRDPGRVAGRGQPRAAAHRPRRPPGRRAEQGHDLPEAPRRPARGGGRRAPHAQRPDRVARATCATRSTCSPSRSSPTSRRAATRRWPTSRRSCAAAPTSPSCPTSSSPTRSTCSPGATRARSSPSCARASCGTASTTRCGPATASKRLAVTSGGTIPDRGLFGVFLPDGTRVGELDEEMVYESRPGETFVLGASTWRIEDITFQKVTVTPAPGEPGKMPFWHGDRPGRPLELGRALGAFVRELRELPAGEGDRRCCATTTRSTSWPRRTCCSTSTSRPRPPASCPTTARSSSSASATRSATGGSACSARSARRSTRRGRWPSSAA